MNTTLNRLIVVTAAGTALTSASVAAATTSPTPQALVRSLIAGSLSGGRLGFGSATTGAGTASGNDRRHHVVGEVEISFDYGQATILYEVFPNRQAAIGDWAGADFAHQPGVTSSRSAPGFPAPALITGGAVSGTDALGDTVSNGFTSLAFLDGNVAVAISDASTTSASGDTRTATIALGKLALEHLRATEATLAGH